MAPDPQGPEIALQSKAKPARFVDRVHFGPGPGEFGRPMQECFFLEALRRLGVAPVHLLDHHVKILVHINSKSAHRTDPSFGGLDRSSAAIKLAAGFLE